MNKLITIIILLTIFSINALSAKPYEKITDLKASEQLPSRALKTEYYQINTVVRSNGFLNIYSIESEFGKYEVMGNGNLIVLLRELYALNELKKLSKTKVFMEAAANSASGSVEAMFNIATKPVETVKGIPGGVTRLFKRGQETAGAAYKGGKKIAGAEADNASGSEDESKEGGKEDADLAETTIETGAKAADWYFGVSASQRKWAKKLGVDPYTSNELLQNALREVAKIDRAGSFSVKFAPIPRIPGSKYIGIANKAIWDLSYKELIELNKKNLLEIGISEELIQQFLSNNSFTPSMQTFLIIAVLELENVKNRQVLIELAITKKTEEFARFYLETIILTTWFNTNKQKIHEVKSYGETPYFIDDKNRIVLLLPIDYLFWTKELTTKASEFTNNVKGPVNCWFLGDISEKSNSGLKKIGWIVADDLNENSKFFRQRYLDAIE